MKQSRIALALLALFAGLAGVALAASPQPLDLGSACGYAILAGSAITNGDTGPSTITGNVAVYPTDTETGMATDTTLDGTDYSGNTTVAAAAKADLATAYNDANALASTVIASELGSTTEDAGVWNAGAADLTGILTLDAQGNTAAVFIFQVSALTTAASSAVSLINGAQAANVFFVDSSSATIGAPTTFAGTLIALTAITLTAPGSTTNGLLAINGAVTFDTAIIGSAVACAAPTATSTPTGTVGIGTATSTPTGTVGIGTATSTPTGTVGIGTATSTPTGTVGIGTATSTPTGTVGIGTATSTPTGTVGIDTATPTPTGTGGIDTATPTPTGTAGIDTATSTPTGTVGIDTATPTPTGTAGAVGNDPASFLGTAADFSILATSEITDAGAASNVAGYVGLNPGTSETGILNEACPQDDSNTSAIAAAQTSALAAYNDAWAQPVTGMISADLGGQTLAPGVYSSSAVVTLTGTLTLNGGGDTSSVFIIQCSSSLVTASGSDVVLTNGAEASNVFWVVVSSATLGTDSTFEGTIIAQTSITVDTGATITGRLLALGTEGGGAVTLQANSIVTPSGVSPCGVATDTSTPTPGASGSATATPTASPGSPTATPTAASGSPTSSPTATRTALPGASPTATPTAPLGTATRNTTAYPSATRLTYFYPSPSRGNVGAVAYDMAAGGSINLRIYNQIGTLVDTITDDEGEGWQHTTVSVDKFAPGVYFYVLSRRYDSGAVENDAPKGFVVLH